MPRIVLRLVIQIALCFLLCTAAQAQRLPLPRIAILWPGDVDAWTNAFLEELRDYGYVNGVSAVIDIRNTGGDFSLGPKFAEELIALNPDVIFAGPAALGKDIISALEKSRKQIPLVVSSYDPIAEGILPSPTNHGQNITGTGGIPDPVLMTNNCSF